MIIYQTPRLTVRGWTMRDAPAFFRIYSNEAITRWILAVPHTTLDEAREHLQRIIDKVAADPTVGFWAIERTADAAVVGTVLLKPLPHDERFEVGWHLAQAEWGHGYATEAAAGALRYGFESLGLDAIYAIALPDNTPSLNVMNRLGMTVLPDTSDYHNLTLAFRRILRDDWIQSIHSHNESGRVV